MIRVGSLCVPMNAAHVTGTRTDSNPSWLIRRKSSFVSQDERYAFMIFAVFKLPYFRASFATKSPSLDHENPSSAGVLKNGGNTLPCDAPIGESTTVDSPFAKNHSSRCNHPFKATPVGISFIGFTGRVVAAPAFPSADALAPAAPRLRAIAPHALPLSCQTMPN